MSLCFSIQYLFSRNPILLLGRPRLLLLRLGDILPVGLPDPPTHNKPAPGAIVLPPTRNPRLLVLNVMLERMVQLQGHVVTVPLDDIKMLNVKKFAKIVQ